MSLEITLTIAIQQTCKVDTSDEKSLLYSR